MLPRSSRPRAADDFDSIRDRMEELRRERSHVAAEKRFPMTGPQPYSVSTRPAITDKRNLHAVFRRLMSR
jgi:hypothetical protein